MASEYSVNISLNTKKAEDNLKNLKKGIDGLTAKKGKQSKQELSASDKQLKTEQQTLTLQNRILTVGNSRLKTITQENKLSQAKGLLTRANNQALEGEFDLSKRNILKAIQQIKLLQKETLIKKGIQTQSTKKVKIENTINKQLQERVRTLGQIVKLRNLGTSAGRLAGRFEFEEALNTRGPGGRMLALPSAEMLDQRVRGSGQAGGFSRNIPRFRFPTPTRGFDTQSALISGAFPLLFGQGPIGALAGGLGGGIGGMFGQMGGFAGGIAATAIVQQIQSALKAISDLGQAMGPFTQNTESVTAAIGLQGSAEEARIRLIEQSEGKTAAFNASMQLMANRIGQDGVDSIQEFGETTRLMNSEFSLAILKIQAFTAGIANFVLRITGLQESLNAAAAQRTVADAAATGDLTAQDLVSRRETIERMGSRGGEANRKAVLLEQLEIDEKYLR